MSPLLFIWSGWRRLLLLTPISPPQKTHYFVHCSLLQMSMLIFSFFQLKFVPVWFPYTDFLPILLENDAYSKDPSVQVRGIMSIPRGWSIKLLKEVTLLSRKWEQCNVPCALNLGKCPELVEREREKRKFWNHLWPCLKSVFKICRPTHFYSYKNNFKGHICIGWMVGYSHVST